MLSRLWAEPSNPYLVRLREKFLGYRPLGISFYNGKSYLDLGRPDLIGEPEDVGDSYHFAVPPCADEYLRLDEAGREAFYLPSKFFSPVMGEFYRMFSGFRESIDVAGNFFAPKDWTTLEDEFAEFRDLYDIAPWGKAVIIYHARNGDMLVMNEKGNLAWHCLSEGSFDPVAEDFEGFLAYFSDYLEKRCPIDSYGPD